MARLKAVNDAVSALVSELAAADLVMHITPGDGAAQGFPTTGDWMMRIEPVVADGTFEIVRATARTTDAITITRSQEDTVAPALWSIGSVVFCCTSKSYLEEMQAEIDAHTTLGAQAEVRLTPKESSSGPEGTMFYDSGDDHVYVATEA